MTELAVALVIFFAVVAVGYILIAYFPDIPPVLRKICIVVLVAFALIWLLIHILPLAEKAAGV